MIRVRVCAAIALAAGTAGAQAPSIRNVVNAAGGIVQALPNGGIAQGAIFTVTGSNMGPGTLALDPAPFTGTRLAGTSASVTVKGTTVAMLMYYTSANQVAGLLPSNTPVGAGTVTVTYNGTTSAPAPINVVQNNAGIFTIPSGGAGEAVVTYPDFSVVSTFAASPCGGPNTACGAANPKDVLILWLTGLGPVSAPDSSGPQPGNMANLPLKLWIGGVQAAVAYQGRSGCCIGVDQVVFTVPDNVPTGCAVPLFVQIDNTIGNYTSIPVAKGSRSCTPVNPSLTPAVMSAVAGGAPVGSTEIKLRRRPNGNGAGTVDRADAQFQKSATVPGMGPFALSLLDIPPVGTCSVANDPNLDLTPAAFTFQGALDAGPSLSLNGPGGNKVLTKTVAAGQPTDYFVSIGQGYFSPGTYTVTGTGGADVGPFTATLAIPAVPALTNQANLGAVTRSNGQTITWTGGDSQYVVLFGASYTDTNLTTGAVFTCVADGGAGTFTVPPTVLLAMPAAPLSPNGVIVFQPSPLPNVFPATGLAAASIDFNANTTIPTTFK
jgi:uncharacterized protein (TIGR03437 family)